MSFSFNTALSGLNANSKALNVIGNNISNANTIGFRSSNITFADVYADSTGARLNGAGNSMQTGMGVKTGAIHTNFTEGNLNEASSPLQSAIQGKGFFIVKKSDGTTNYTRAGDFTVDKNGNLKTSGGAQVQGYLAQNGVIAGGTALSSLQIPLGQTLAPNVTTNATLRMNLNSNAATGANFNAPVTVYDSRGTARTLNLSFTKQADGSFQTTGTLDGTAVEMDADGAGASTNPVSFVFDTNGQLTSPTTLSITPDQTTLGGASLPTIAINLRETNPDGTPGALNVTSYASASALATTKQDGFSSGELTGVTVGEDGSIFGTFSNGESRLVAQYALASFGSEEGLQKLGGNMFGETSASGQATVGAPGTGGRGSIVGGYTEQSNVNITNEFVELIEAQRGFQSNSKVITSINQTFQELLQIL